MFTAYNRVSEFMIDGFGAYRVYCFHFSICLSGFVLRGCPKQWRLKDNILNLVTVYFNSLKLHHTQPMAPHVAHVDYLGF